MKKKYIIGSSCLLYGILFISGSIKSFVDNRYFLLNLIDNRFKFLIESIRAYLLGDMLVEHILAISNIMGIVVMMTFGVVLILIGISIIFDQFRLPRIPLFFVYLFIFSFFYQIWVCIRYVALSGFFAAIFYGIIIWYAWMTRKRDKEYDEKINKGVKWAFYILLIIISIMSIIVLVYRPISAENIGIIQ